MGLVIERLIGESFVIGDNITVTLTEIRGATPESKPGRLRAKLLIQAPRDVVILRSELVEQDRKERGE